MLHKIVNALKWMLLAAALSIFLFRMFVYDLFVTVSAAILQPFFEDREHMQWIFLVMVPLTVLFFSLISNISWRVHKIRNEQEKRAYLQTLGANRFDRAKEKEALKKDRGFRAELISYAIVAVLESAFTFNFLIAVLTAPLLFLIFWLIDKKLWLDLRETWAFERIRLNPDHPQSPDDPS